MKESKYIDLLCDFGFKRTFGKENCSEEFLIDFLNELFKNDEELRDIVSVKYHNTEKPQNHKMERGVHYDITCETSTGHRFIVEMQRRNQANFGNRVTYYMGREIVEQGMKIKEKEKWNYELLPVVGVFVTEFEQPDFRGRVVVHGKMLDPETGKTVLNQIKCAFVQLDAFNKTKDECETGFDKWIYILKNMERLQEIPFNDYKNGLFKRLGELSEVASLTGEEWVEYNAILKQARDYYATIEYARNESVAKVAKNLKEQGVDVEIIASSTGLSVEEIAAL